MSTFPSTVYQLTKRPEPETEQKADVPARTLTQAQQEARVEEEAHQMRVAEINANRAARIEQIRQRAAAFQTLKEFREAYPSDHSWVYALHDFDLMEELFGHLRKVQGGARPRSGPRKPSDAE
jgi:hypothetical protein